MNADQIFIWYFNFGNIIFVVLDIDLEKNITNIILPILNLWLPLIIWFHYNGL